MRARTRNLVGFGCAALALTAQGLVPAAAGAAASAKCADAAAVRVVGDVAKPLRLCRADLEKLGKKTVTSKFGTHHSGPRTYTFSGPLLYDVVQAAKPKATSAKHDIMRFTVTAIAGDGFAATVAWGEFDPEVQNGRFLLATTQDGKPCKPARLVAPDKAGTRYITDVVKLKVTRN